METIAPRRLSSVTAPDGSGYFVLSHDTWTGNLGGLAGADAKCLSDLTTYTGWMGYATANSNGQLVAAKVHAFLCSRNTVCDGLMPLTTYYFANAGNASAGGGYFTTDLSGYGPNDFVPWNAVNYFYGLYIYWSAHYQNTSTAWSGAIAAESA